MGVTAAIKPMQAKLRTMSAETLSGLILLCKGQTAYEIFTPNEHPQPPVADAGGCCRGAGHCADTDPADNVQQHQLGQSHQRTTANRHRVQSGAALLSAVTARLAGKRSQGSGAAGPEKPAL